MTLPDMSVSPPYKKVPYFGGHTVEHQGFAHKRSPIIWVASEINDPAGGTLQDKWEERKWMAAAAGNFPANHPDKAGQAFKVGLVDDFFDDTKEFWNAGDFPNKNNDHVLAGDIIVGKDMEGNLVRLVITEQHELAAQGEIK